jgi:hypothetical protein
MQKSVLLCLGVLLCLTGCDANKLPPVDTWSEFKMEDGTISARFPEKPKTKIKNKKMPFGNGDMKTRVLMYENSTKDVILSIGKITTPLDPSQLKSKESLQGALFATLAMHKGKLLSQKNIKSHGLPGIEWTFEAKKGGIVRTRSFVDTRGTTMYYANVVSLSEGYLSGSEADAFLDSVKIRRAQVKRPPAKKAK